MGPHGSHVGHSAGRSETPHFFSGSVASVCAVFPFTPRGEGKRDLDGEIAQAYTRTPTELKASEEPFGEPHGTPRVPSCRGRGTGA